MGKEAVHGSMFVELHWSPNLVQEIHYQESNTVGLIQEDTAARHLTSQSGTMNDRKLSEDMS